MNSGAEALRELLEREFAVIVLDVNMPDIDGIETAQLIRKHGRTSHTPIIFVTAYADEMQTERGYELGAVDYILTPVVPAILRSKVRVFVDLYRAQRRAAKVARAEAARTAAEAAQRSSDLIALASRELAASLDLEPSMERLLEVLVPTVGGCAVLSVDTDGRRRSPVSPGSRARAPARDAGAAAAAGPARDGRGAKRRLCARDSRRCRRLAAIGLRGCGSRTSLPLKVGERNIGALAVGTADHESAVARQRAACSRSRRAPRSRSTTRSSTAA